MLTNQLLLLLLGKPIFIIGARSCSENRNKFVHIVRTALSNCLPVTYADRGGADDSGLVAAHQSSGKRSADYGGGFGEPMSANANNGGGGDSNGAPSQRDFGMINALQLNN